MYIDFSGLSELLKPVDKWDKIKKTMLVNTTDGTIAHIKKIIDIDLNNDTIKYIDHQDMEYTIESNYWYYYDNKIVDKYVAHKINWYNTYIKK